MVDLHTSMLPKKVKKFAETLEGDEKTGAKIILKALEAPLDQIAKKCRT